MFVMPRKLLLTFVLCVYVDAAKFSVNAGKFEDQRNRFANEMRVEELLEEK